MQNIVQSKAIIDFYRLSPDEGLSFRTAEALALKKKIITNRDLNANNLYKFKENILFTCHDHQFVQTIANRIIEFNKNGMIDRLSTYDEYLEYKEDLETK